jgi:hypothetical protein
LSAYLHREAGRGQILILDDRRIPGTRANIDLIAVCPSGIFVIDAKNHNGKVEVRATGFGRWREERLMVQGRDRTRLVDGMSRQVTAVKEATEAGGFGSEVPVHAIVCFVNSDWDLFLTALTVNGVQVTAPRPLRQRLRKEGPLGAETRARLARLLALRLPPAAASGVQ